jgi:hypothetical protein
MIEMNIDASIVESGFKQMSLISTTLFLDLVVVKTLGATLCVLASSVIERRITGLQKKQV